MAKRKGLSKRTRFDVFKRDAFACQYCGRTPPSVVLEIDHIIPVADGGTDDPANLITACFDCNRGKADGSLDAIPQSRAEVMARRRELAEQTAEYNAFLIQQRAAEDFAIDQLGQYWNDCFRPEREWGKFTFGQSRIASIRRFLQDLAEAEIVDAIEYAMARYPVIGKDDDRTWRYFCGICWRKIKERK